MQAATILQEYGMSGTTYVVTSWVGETERMNFGDLRRLRDEFGWEIGSHSKSHQNLEFLDDETIEDEVVSAKQALEVEGFPSVGFAAPYGAYNAHASKVIAQHHYYFRGFWEPSNPGEGPHNDWPFNRHNVVVLRAHSCRSATELAEEICQVYYGDGCDSSRQADGSLPRPKVDRWILVVFHEVGTELPEPGVCNPNSHDYWTVDEETLRDVASFVDSIPVPVVNPQDVFGRVSTEWLVPYGQELHVNAQFNHSSPDLTGYYANAPERVSLDLDGYGVAPSPQDSIRIEGVDYESTNFYHDLPNQVSSDVFYIAEVSVNVVSLTEGLVGLYIDEYNEAGQWISGSNIGGVFQDKHWPSSLSVQTIVGLYIPSSQLVQNVRLQVYVEHAKGSVAIDNLSFRQL